MNGESSNIIHIQIPITKNFFAIGLFLATISPWTSSCAYRLTNLHIKNPNGISTVAVEAVYDTGSEVVPHDELWSELQKSFAANGHLQLTTVEKADALVRAHIRETGLQKSGDRSQDSRFLKDPELYPGQQGPALPNQFRNLSTARDYFTKSNLSMTVDIEVWDTRLRKLILQRSYSGAFQTISVYGDNGFGSTSGIRETTFIRSEESFRHGFTNISRSIAEKVVSDLLVR